MNPDYSRTGARQPAVFIWLWLVLFFVWVAASSSVAVDSLVSGAAICAVLGHFFAKHSTVWRSLRCSPSRLYFFVLYTGVFAKELVRANIAMLRYVYSPRVDIKPGIVTIKTKLKSPIGRLALANSIALTPGSLVVDVKDDTLFVHWLDVQTTDPDEAARIIAEPFEKYLEKVFG